MSELLYQTLRGINRNIVECKGIRHISHIPGSIGINRNIVECKVCRLLYHLERISAY